MKKTWYIKRYKFNQLSRIGIYRGTERNMECFLWTHIIFMGDRNLELDNEKVCT